MLVEAVRPAAAGALGLPLLTATPDADADGAAPAPEPVRGSPPDPLVPPAAGTGGSTPSALCTVRTAFEAGALLWTESATSDTSRSMAIAIRRHRSAIRDSPTCVNTE